MLTLPFQPGLTFCFQYMDFLRIFAGRLLGIKMLARFQKPGEDFQSGLKPSSM